MSRKILEIARTQGTPIIDGDTATFIWQGKQAPLLSGDFSDWERGTPVSLTRVAPKLWAWSIKLPLDAYIEYAFLEGEERVPDPFNSRTTPNGLGQRNHCFYMPAGKPTYLTRHNSGIPSGNVSQHSVPTWGLLAGQRRDVWLYQPPVDEPVPLMVLWDGRDYLRRARLPTIIDNLIAAGRIQPIALAMLQNGGKARMIEYACSEATLLFLLACILPLAQANLNLLDIDSNPGAFGVAGASMGGLMALFTGLRLPQIFGKVLSQSGAFAFNEYQTLVFDLVKQSPQKQLDIWMDVGLYDFQTLLTSNQQMNALLTAGGWNVTYREFNAGHNYPAWRNEIGFGLEHIFPINP